MDQPVQHVELAFRPKESFTAPSSIQKPGDQVVMTTEAKEHHATQQKSRAPRRSRKYARPATESLKSPAKKEGPTRKELVIHEWSDVPEPLHEAVIASLKEVCHDLDTLARSGYKVREMTQEDLEGYAKCMNCRERKRVLDTKLKTACFYHPMKRNQQQKQYKYPCCGKRQACASLPAHVYAPVQDFILENWQNYRLTPSPEPGLCSPRRVVALDCEMVEVEGGSAEVAQICAVDILTSEVIVEKYVVPSRTVTDWRTPWSGMSQKLLEDMKEAGKTVNGWEEARKALWAHIGPDTILVGQSLQHDLDIIRMVHLSVVDTVILSREAVAKDCKQSWGLKRLCKQMLDRDIQQSRRGHDCLEDTMATREVVLWCVRHPNKFQEWAVSQREWMKKANGHCKSKQKGSDKVQVKQPREIVPQVLAK
ncbi:RNA exonuclease 3 [Aspergillus udagawae]|uniref:RNA exonuclease 3 n=1 Tax=Aspergillus udagawae TaxID=91492 RepID=A0ABQ1AMI5_9EURO|nr:RNA exonuclease 3 [Aspergillus udagawae]